MSFRIVRATAIAGVAMAAVVATSTPSSAALQLMAVDVVSSDVESGGSTTAPAPAVTAACSIDAAVLQANGIQFVVSGSASASGGLVLATHVHCTVKTQGGSYSWGGPSGDLFGPTAVAAGSSSTVPFEKLGGLYVCAYGSAFFQGGVTRNTRPSPGC